MHVATYGIGKYLVAFALAVLLVSAPAMAQYGSNPQDLQSRIDELERQLDQLERYTYESAPTRGTIGGGNYTSSVRADEANLPATAVLNRRVDDLETTVRDLTGEIERLSFQVSQLSQQFERVMGDVDYRLRALEGNLAPGESAPVAAGAPTGGNTFGPPADQFANAPQAAPTRSTAPNTDRGPSPRSEDILGVEADMPQSAGPPAMAGAGQPQMLGAVPASRLSGSEEADFEIGMQLLRQGDFGDAENAFQEFIAGYPSSARTGEAYFWLGESRFVRGEYADAATAYLTSARDYGGDEKAPDSLLKLGMSLAALGQSAEACSAFDQVARAYPNASDRVQRNVARERAANNCR